MKITYKINVYNLLTYLLVFAIIKPYFLPAGLRQASKIIILISVFLFTISGEKKERIVNLSWLFSGCVLLSAEMCIRDRFSALSRERIEQMVKYFEENDFQVFYAAPPEKISSIGAFIQSTVSLVCTGRYTNAVEGLVKE